jgi:gamma-glutamyltranspeptidase/glutathione hydrolase
MLVVILDELPADTVIDFSLPGARNEFGYVPAPANYIRPGKRPLSSITPVIVDHVSNGSLYFVIGAAGGSRIPSATVQALWHVLDHDMNVSQALAYPRFHDQLVPAVTTFEYAFDDAIVAAMGDREHNVTRVPPGLSSVQGLRLMWDGKFEAAGEPRQKNSAGIIV